MDYTTREDKKAAKIGANAGYYTALCLFATMAYYITGKAGLHHVDARVFAMVTAIIFITGFSLSTLKTIGCCSRCTQ